MTDALSPTVPAGWYPDPWGSASQRWWDGSAWSERVTAVTDASANDSEQPHDGSPPHEHYEPAAVRATYAPPTPVAEAPDPGSPFPSRRALRHATITEDATPAEPAAEDWMTPGSTTFAAPAAAAFTAEPLPAFTQVPEFTPEPVSALPPPVWTEPEPAADPVPVAVEPSVPEPRTVEPAGIAADTAVAVAATIPAPEPAAPPAASASPASGAAPDADPDDDWAASLAGWDDIDTSDTTPPDSRPIFGDAPPVSYSQRAVRYQPLHGRTSPVWLIVFMPLVHAAALVGSLFLFPSAAALGSSLDSFLPGSASFAAVSEWLMFAAAPLGIAFFLFTFIMGFQDRARLRLLGHDETASPWWIVLHPLVYLIVRSIRVRQCTGRRGSGPLTTYLCFYVAPPIALVVATAVVSALDGAIPA